MCGIAGYSGDFAPELLELMAEKLEHRGPDDQGAWHSPGDSIGLCHRRLSIIDLSPLGKQPMWDASRQVVIVFNGEIYNYKELRSLLEQHGFHFNSRTDTEVLLNLYLHAGTDMLRHLNGIYAFAIWDTRTESLFIARDAMGTKPLYYADIPSKGVLFASEIKALLQEQSLDLAIDAHAVADYVTYMYCPAPRTMLQNVKKLLPGHAMVVKSGRIESCWQHYNIPCSVDPDDAMTVAEAQSELYQKLEQATLRQLVADVPVGAFLSGGLDSSALVACIRNSTDIRPECFTIAFKDDSWAKEGMTSDLPYAKTVADLMGVKLHTIEVGPEITDLIEKMVYHLDEPQADPACLNLMLICSLAQDNGIKVLLSGTGGDDIFSGYRRHTALTYEKYWTWLPEKIRTLAAESARRVDVSSPTIRRAAKVLAYADKNINERIAGYFNWIDPLNRNYLFSSWLRHELIDDIAYNPLLTSLNSIPDGIAPLNKMLWLEQKFFLADHNLNYTDKMSMATGVEVRVPYLDTDLVDFAWKLPVDFKHRHGTAKWIFKKAMEPYLPRDIIYRPKTGFGVPLRHWLHNELKPMLEDLLSPESLRKRNLFDAQGVRNLIIRNQEGRIDATYPIFSLMCIELWCRIFIDRRGNI